MQLGPNFAATRESLHTVAEHVLAAARYRAVGRIGLTPTAGGVGTPPFDGTVIRVDGTELVVEDRGGERRAPITTLRAAGELIGIPSGLPAGIYPAATPMDPEAPLSVDADDAAAIAAWYALGAGALDAFAAELVQAGAVERPPDRTLWPEHFDLAMTAAEVNYGLSPGDAELPEPYAYAGPWERPLPGDQRFWNQPFGAALDHASVRSVQDLVGFYRADWVASRAV